MKNKAITLIASILFLTGCPNLTGAHKTKAQESAKIWAQELGMEYKSVVCNKQDTDGDGYVSCTFMLEEDKRTQVECAGAWTLNEGCRDPKAQIRR